MIIIVVVVEIDVCMKKDLVLGGLLD